MSKPTDELRDEIMLLFLREMVRGGTAWRGYSDEQERMGRIAYAAADNILAYRDRQEKVGAGYHQTTVIPTKVMTPELVIQTSFPPP